MAFVVTPEQLAGIAGRPTALMPGLAEWMNRLCPDYEIDSAQEFCHFLAQACHETDHFRTLREYASGSAYEGRSDLGNTQPGDGVRFRGRGIFQTTGRANYLQLGIRKGQRDLFVNNPELLEQPEYAVWSACEYWRTRGLNDIANQDDGAVLKKKYRGNLIDVSPVEYISITVNGGMNGLADRKKFYAIGQQLLVEEAPAPRALPSARGVPPMPTEARKAARKAAKKPAKKAAKKAAKRSAPAKQSVRKTAKQPSGRAASPARKAAAGTRRPPGRKSATTKPTSPVRTRATAKPGSAVKKGAAKKSAPKKSAPKKSTAKKSAATQRAG